MSMPIPDSHLDLITAPLTVTLATVMPDGQPQLTAVWCLYEAGEIRISVADASQKAQNLTKHPQATVLAIDTNNPGRYLEVRGTVQFDKTNINDFRQRLMTAYGYPNRYQPVDDHVMIRLTPKRIITHG